MDDKFPEWKIKTQDEDECEPASGTIKLFSNYSPCSFDGQQCAERLRKVAELNPSLLFIIRFINVYYADEPATKRGLKQLQSQNNVEIDILKENEYQKLLSKFKIFDKPVKEDQKDKPVGEDQKDKPVKEDQKKTLDEILNS